MSLNISSVTSGREGSAAFLEISGNLPSPAYEILSVNSDIGGANPSDSKISIEFIVEKKSGFFPQSLKRVRQKVSVGRASGSFQVVIICNGESVFSGNVEI